LTLPAMILLFIMLKNLSEDWVSHSLQNGGPIQLSQGWFNGKRIDLTDRQYRTLRAALPKLLIGLSVFVILSQFMKSRFCQKSKDPLIYFYLCFSFLFMAFLHAAAMIFPVCVALINFSIAKYTKSSKWNVALTWGFNMFILFTSDYFDGYRIASLFGETFAPLDSFRGPMNWRTCFNMLFCRLVAYNMDYRECLLRHNEHAYTKRYNAEWSEYRKRQETLLSPQEDFDLKYYLAFVFYVPLYIAGPVMGYTAFLTYVKQEPQKEVTSSQITRMIISTTIYAVLVDIILHYCYVPGFIEYRFWQTYDTPYDMPYYVGNTPHPYMTPFQVGCLGWSYLMFMYMKFLIIWRMFRIYTLLDGINPPENMNRCINNNLKASDFWRSWHRSLYMFIVRYIYVPMGGSKNRVWSVWVIFMFMAVWHDLYRRWMAWAFFNCCLIIIEVIIVKFVADSQPIKWLREISNNSTRPWYNILLAELYAWSTSGMIVANLAILNGFEMSFHFIKRLLFDQGSQWFILTTFTLQFLGVQMMLYIRESERKRGIVKAF
jgi:D-alanyl-lipoteichoic acid acyltransferase DltB (MBOAT superfamily)